MHPACPNKKQNHLQNSFLRRALFWVRKTFSKPASLKRASLVDLETLVSQVLSDCPRTLASPMGFILTTATDHKNNLNSSALKKRYARTLRVETIANSAGGTAEVAIVAQPSTGFLNTRFYQDGSPTEDTEDSLGRITVGSPA